jgi:hypothetical protein
VSARVDLAGYLDPVEGPVRFVREQMVLPDGRKVGDALADDEWVERDLLRPVFARGRDGLPSHRLVYLELPRGHWKSGGAAAVALAEAILSASTDVVVAAADQEQAGIIGQNISGYLGRGSRTLRASVKATRAEFTVPVRDSRIRILSSDVPGSWGLGGLRRRFRLVCDELVAWPAERGEQLWQALVSATGKVDDTQTIVLSNAGFDAGRGWQWRVREAADREPWGYLFAADGIVASWITAEWVEQMRALLPPPAFDRLIGNRWTSESGDFVSAEQWRRCVDPLWSPQTGGSGPFFAGLDLGLTKDRTCLAVVHREGERVVLDDLQVWSGTRGEPVSIATVERAVLDAARRFRTIRLTCDPWQLKGSIERLRAAGVATSEFVFSQSSIGRLSAALFESITGATLRVYPDAELEEEILGLRVVQTANGWRFDHRASGYSDRAVALAIALQAARRAGSGRRMRVSAPEGRIEWNPSRSATFAERVGHGRIGTLPVDRRLAGRQVEGA